MPLKEQILKLVTKENGLTDREITNKLSGLDHPPQPVNQACRSLARNGKLIRRKRKDGRIVNFPPDGLSPQNAEATARQNLSNRSKRSIQRTEKRNSPATEKFREEIEALLQDAEADVAYRLKKDLSAMTDMPFYGKYVRAVRTAQTPLEMVKSYTSLLLKHGCLDLSKKLLRKIKAQQSQTFRKCAPRLGPKGKMPGLWEHAIPVNVVVEEILKLLEKRDLTDLDQLLNVYMRAGQRWLTSQEDRLLSRFSSNMPKGWNWRSPDVDPLARYKEVGINRFQP